MRKPWDPPGAPCLQEEWCPWPRTGPLWVCSGLKGKAITKEGRQSSLMGPHSLCLPPSLDSFLSWEVDGPTAHHLPVFRPRLPEVLSMFSFHTWSYFLDTYYVRGTALSTLWIPVSATWTCSFRPLAKHQRRPSVLGMQVRLRELEKQVLNKCLLSWAL